MSTKQTNTITIEHVVVTSSKPYEKVVAALEERLGVAGDFAELLKQLEAANAPWEETKQALSKRLGKGGFMIFVKVDHGLLLSLAGKPSKAIQYTLGNPLLAVQMTKHNLGASLYAPYKLSIYEDENGNTIVTYDRFSSILDQFHNEEVTRIARQVSTLQDELVSAVTA